MRSVERARASFGRDVATGRSRRAARRKEMTAEFQEFRVSNDALNDPEELRRRIDAEGYLFFRSLQDADKLRALRRDILGVLREGGWVRPGTDLMDGIAD